MQEGVIFSEPIARNIAVDDSDIDTERMAKAAETACIKDYIMSPKHQIEVSAMGCRFRGGKVWMM